MAAVNSQTNAAAIELKRKNCATAGNLTTHQRLLRFHPTSHGRTLRLQG